MRANQQAAQYANYTKPRWAPPAWLFGPVWTLLYVLIAISFGYVGYLYVSGAVSLGIVAPFALNLILNVAFTTLQFRFRAFVLAALDAVLILATLIWALVAIYPIAAWVAYLNLPYLAWVCFATVLQLAVTALNKRA